jgi:hypothetical protein
VTGLEIVVGMLVGWFARRAKHAGEQIDKKVDDALDTGLQKLHDLVAGKLHDEPALKVLEGEVVDTGEATTRTQARVRLALEEAVDTDKTFATQLTAATEEVRAAQTAAGAPVAGPGPHGVATHGGVTATHGSIAIGGVTGGSVSVTREDLPNVDSDLYQLDERTSAPVIGLDERDGNAVTIGYGVPLTISFADGTAHQSDVPVTIYLADGTAHEDVEIAVDQALAAAGLYVTERGDPVIGSWWRVLWAKARQTAKTPVGREAAAVATHAAEQRVVLDKDADITAKLMQNLGPVITALQPEQNAVVRLGAALIVKADGVLVVHQLTPAQQLQLNHSPTLLRSPRGLLNALESASDGEGSHPAIGL